MKFDSIHEIEHLEQKFNDLLIDGRINLLLRYYLETKYKSEATEEQKKILEYIIDSGLYPRLTEDQKRRKEDLFQETLGIMIEEELIYEYNAHFEIQYLPTAKGKRINEKGGWIKYLADNNRAEKNRNRLYVIGQISFAFAGAYYLLEFIKDLPITFINWCK